MSDLPSGPVKQRAKAIKVTDDSGAGNRGHSVVPTASEASAYIATMTSELLRIAKARDLRTIHYFLDMARAEAEATARKSS